MFHTFLLLGNREILSKVWIAAHWENKLTKAHIYECNLDSVVQSIVAPKVVIALRTSGHLLVGVVRIYHRKVKFLLADCNDAFLGMKISFPPGAQDLAEGDREASYNAITLPEELHQFHTQLPDRNKNDVVEHFTLNQSRVEDITMKEDYGRPLHDSFGDYLYTFRQDTPKKDTFDVSTSRFSPEQTSVTPNGEDRYLFTSDCFGDEGENSDFFDNQLFIDSFSPFVDVNQELIFPTSTPIKEHYLEGAESCADILESPLEDLNNTTLLSNADDGFVLDPLIWSVVECRRHCNKRKLIVDPVKEITVTEMCHQWADFSDTLSTVSIAQMHSIIEMKMSGGVLNLLWSPINPIFHTELLLQFTHRQRLDIPNNVNQEPAETEIDMLRKMQEVVRTGLSHFSSSYTEEPSNKSTTSTLTSNVSITVQEESEDLLWYSPPTCLAEGEITELQENVWDSNEHQRNQRTSEMLSGLRSLNQSGENLFSFQKLCKNKKRKEVSGKFYSFLMLKKTSAIEIVQSVSYCDIVATPGPRFYTI